MSQPDSSVSYQPRWPSLVATIVFVLAALTVCGPMLAGRFLLGDDQLLVGYGFREFGADWFKTHGGVPQWNPYQFGGMPFIAAMHGDIFYPTAWLRWFLPIDTAMNLGWLIHFVLAGSFMYLFLRALRLSWTAALVGGVAYELSGIVASMANPGHDGKLYVSALAPLAFFALLRAIRDRKMWGYGVLALSVGLCLLSPHYQMTYYLLVVLGLWALYLVFFDPERPAGIRWPVPLGLAVLAVILGLGISGLQALPFLEYIPYSPRGAGGPSAGWDYATSFSFPVKEIPTTILPEFNGVLEQYWGANVFKSHTEYLGAAVAILAIIGIGFKDRRRLVIALAVLGGLALMIAFGRHFPFYRVWYEVMPMMKKVRAVGMAFFLVAWVVCIYAALGVERLLKGQARWRSVAIPLGIVAGIAVLGSLGALQTVAEVLVDPEQTGKLAANAAALRAGGLRLLLVAAGSGLGLWLILKGVLRGWAIAAALVVIVAGDLWSVDRRFFPYHPGANVLFRSDAILDRLKTEKAPYRVFNAGVYQASHLMAHRIQTILGYHGNEIRFYDDLLGGKNVWRNQINLGLWELLAVRYLIVPDSQPIPGFHIAVGPVETAAGGTAYLYEQDTVPPYVRVMSAAAEIPEDQVVSTVVDPRFPYESIILYPDSSAITPLPITGAFVPPPPVTAELAEWEPGRMRIQLTGSATTPTYLFVSENWYPDWQASIDGQPAPVHRGDHTFLTVVIPPGAREVTLAFHDDGYAKGKLISLVSTLLALGMILVPAVRGRRGVNPGV